MSIANQHWSVSPVRLRRADTSKGPVEYADVGDGPAILYFHGTGAGNDAAVMIEAALVTDGFRLIVPNRPGYYGTPLACGRTANGCADLALELLDHVAVTQVVVVGTSGGGPPALRFVARHPSRAAALTLQCAQSHWWDSNRWMPSHLRWAYRLFRHQRVFKPLLRFGFRREMAKLRREPKLIIRQMSGVRSPRIENTEASASFARLLADSELRCAQQPDGIENDWAILFSGPWLMPNEVRCPTIIFHDEMDPIVPFEHAECASQMIPGARLVKLDAGGHLIWLGKDAELMRKLRTEFIRQANNR